MLLVTAIVQKKTKIKLRHLFLLPEPTAVSMCQTHTRDCPYISHLILTDPQ